jgi:hypothetical protein
MREATRQLYGAGRWRSLAALAVLVTIGLAVWIPSSAHATIECDNVWTGTNGGFWFEAANWSKGHVPTSAEAVCIGEPGTYEVRMKQTSSTKTVTVKSLAIGEGQTLSVESSCSQEAVLHVTGELTVLAKGAVVLTDGESCSGKVLLESKTTSNAGTVTSEPGSGGARSIQGNFTNTGTLQINTSTGYKAELLNEAAINLANEKTLFVAGGSTVVNEKGNIAGAGIGAVIMDAESSFLVGRGTTSGTKPVILEDASLTYDLGNGEQGANNITMRGEHATVSGPALPGQLLTVESLCTKNAHVIVPKNAEFENYGSITLTDLAACAPRPDAALDVAENASLTNRGTITFEPGHGGTRELTGNVRNTGTLQINANTIWLDESAPEGHPQLGNEGIVNIADGAVLAAAKGLVTNGTGGKIVATGTGQLISRGPGSEFIEGAGTTSGNPVVVESSHLRYSGAGSSKIAIRGESLLEGDIAANQQLILQASGVLDARPRIAGSFTNAGAITLTDQTCCGKAILAPKGALTNSGTITTEPGLGGSRAIAAEGSLTNTGTLQVNANTELIGTGAELVNQGTVNVANEVQLSAAGQTVNNNSGAISGTGSGALVVSGSGGAFKQGEGTTNGSLPVIVDDAALYTGTGPSSIAIRGEHSLLSGTIEVGQTLAVQSTCSENARVAVGSFTSSGTIVLTNADSCANSAVLDLGGGTLTNKGTLRSEFVHGGTRMLEGGLLNEGIVSLGAGETLNVSGRYTQTKKGIFEPVIAGAANFGALSAAKTAAIGGTLTIAPAFKGSKGEKFGILGSSGLSGTFRRVKNAKIQKKLKYRPIYSATGVALEIS